MVGWAVAGGAKNRLMFYGRLRQENTVAGDPTASKKRKLLLPVEGL